MSSLLVYNRVYRLEIQSAMMVFSIGFVCTIAPVTFSLVSSTPSLFPCVNKYTEAEFKEKHGVWDPMPDLTLTSPYDDSVVDSDTFTMGNPMP
jgi:hypothetical protein